MGEPILEPGRQAGMCVHDGTAWRKVAGDGAGHVHVDVESSALPSGAATETTLSSILTELQQKLETADLSLDTQKHLDTHNLVHSSKIECHRIWNVSVPAGATQTILATTSGHGHVFYCMIYLDGLSGDVRNSELRFYVDGETTPSTKLSIWFIRNYICVLRAVELSFGGISHWDTTNHIYGCWFRFGPSFESSLKIEITNGDTANASTITCGIWVEWLK